VLARLGRKLEQAADAVPNALIDRHDGGARVGVITLGSCAAAVGEAVDRLRAQGQAIDYMRGRAFPFGAEVRRFLSEHERLFVVEQNRDAQLRALLALETGKARDDMTPILDYGGVPLSAEPIVEAIKSSCELRAASSHRSGLGSQFAVRSSQSGVTP
jgi:2-oxoglutarate ferredoxin oxidoreductase subunit alpha